MLNEITLNGNLIIALYVLFGGELAILTGAAQLFFSKGRLENLLLAVFYFVFGVLLVQFVLFSNFTGIEKEYSIIFGLHLSLLFASGPFFYLYCLMLVTPEFKIQKRHFFLFVPAILLIFLDLYVQFLDNPHRHVILSQILHGSFNDSWSVFPVIRAVAFAQCVFYHGIMIRNIAQLWSFKEMSLVIRVSVVLNITVIIFYVMLFLYAIFGGAVLFDSGLVLVTTLTIAVFFFGFRYPEFFYQLQQEVKKKKYERSHLQGLNTDLIKNKLIKLMEEDNLFCFEDITIKKIADELELTSHQLSEYLNNNLNMNFKTFINTYRVEDAKRLLIEEPDHTILSIAYAVGFNSPSTFYSAFSKFVGTTPHRFRQTQAR